LQIECCGFGGTFSVFESDVSVSMGRDRVAGRITHGAEYMRQRRHVLPDAPGRVALRTKAPQVEGRCIAEMVAGSSAEVLSASCSASIYSVMPSPLRTEHSALEHFALRCCYMSSCATPSASLGAIQTPCRWCGRSCDRMAARVAEWEQLREAASREIEERTLSELAELPGGVRAQRAGQRHHGSLGTRWPRSTNRVVHRHPEKRAARASW